MALDGTYYKLKNTFIEELDDDDLEDQWERQSCPGNYCGDYPAPVKPPPRSILRKTKAMDEDTSPLEAPVGCNLLGRKIWYHGYEPGYVCQVDARRIKVRFPRFQDD